MNDLVGLIFGCDKHEPLREKTCLQGFRPRLRHKQGCTATKDGKRLESSDLGSTVNYIYRFPSIPIGRISI